MSKFKPYEFSDSEHVQNEIGGDHHLDGTPVLTAFMRNGAETVWINAYVSGKYRMVIETYPPAPVAGHPGAQKVGLVREVPVGIRQELHEAFAASVERHERDGWEHVSPRVTTEEKA